MNLQYHGEEFVKNIQTQALIVKDDKLRRVHQNIRLTGGLYMLVYAPAEYLEPMTFEKIELRAEHCIATFTQI